MGEYERLVSRIEEYKGKEDVVETDEVISALDLYNIMSARFAKLRSIENGDVLKRKINKDNNSIVKKIRDIRNLKTLLNFKCDNVMPMIGDNKLKITFCFEKSRLCISVGKNIGENDIYYILKDSKDDLLVNKYYDDIMNIFSILEEYHKLFLIGKDNSGYNKGLKVYYDIFDVEFICYNDGKVYSCLSINKNIDKDRISGIEYINKPSIGFIIDTKKNSLLNKIPVQKSSLPPMYKQILDDREKKSVKRLIRK